MSIVPAASSSFVRETEFEGSPPASGAATAALPDAFPDAGTVVDDRVRLDPAIVLDGLDTGGTVFAGCVVDTVEGNDGEGDCACDWDCVVCCTTVPPGATIGTATGAGAGTRIATDTGAAAACNAADCNAATC